MEQITTGVFHSHVPGRTLPPYQATECYWIGSRDEVILVDTGDGGELAQKTLWNDWEALGRPRVLAVFATHGHPDHTGTGPWAQQTWGCPIYLPPDDLVTQSRWGSLSLWQPAPSGEPLTVGGVRIEMLPMPGHTPGQWNFWLPESRGLLAGDNVLGNTTVVVTPPDGNLRDYLTTLRRMIALNPAWIGPGHGDLVTRPAEYLQRYLDHRLERAEEILALLRQRPMTLRELAERVYRDRLAPDRLYMGEWMILGHLDDLIAQGTVGLDEDRYRII
ncbi:MAG: MBL fold metallo-hydrolase [Sulfobacillus sp.]|nr:MBL fold metallo-hydrolase [Sulfobacillus sp.]